MRTDQPLDGRVAVVTGAGAGLGRAYATTLASLGAAVVANDLGGSVGGDGRGDAAADSVVAEIAAAGGRATASPESVAAPHAGAEIVGRAIEVYGRIDIVVNNAGILRDKAFDRLDADAWDAVVDVHLKGSYAVAQAAWPHMLEQDFGRIVNTTSAAGLFGNAGHANYGAAKAGVFGLTRMLAVEAAGRNILVNAVAPLASTRMSGSTDGDRQRAGDMMGALFAQLAPEHVAPLVAWLVHPDCRTQGKIFSAGGGRFAEIFMAETAGWVGRDSSWKDVRDNLDSICDHRADTVPDGMKDEIALYLDALG